MNETFTAPGETASEGRAEVFLPPAVFYNPVQEFNRDLTIAVVSHYAKRRFAEKKLDQNLLKPGIKVDGGLNILEGLSASGLRSVRFALEIPGIQSITANDLDHTAVEYIERNIKHNKVEHLVTASKNDAALLMYQQKRSRCYDVIDLDPYGSPTVFLDAAVQAIADGGLLCVTCTDTAVLCGNASETCYAKYGAMSIRAPFCHEMALRIMYQCVAAHAARYGRYIEPLLAVSVDFYVRLFMTVHTGQRKVKAVASQLAHVYVCGGCSSHHLARVGDVQPAQGGQVKYTPGWAPALEQTCAFCRSRHRLVGPIWAESLCHQASVYEVVELVKGMPEGYKLGTADRVIGMLTVLAEELADVPLYYVLDDLCKVVRCNVPPALAFRSALLSTGHRVSSAHAHKGSVKTDAPPSVLWDVLRRWVQTNPVAERWLTGDGPAARILAVAPTLEVDFKVREDAKPPSLVSNTCTYDDSAAREFNVQGLVRYQVNPCANWGPKMRASADLVNKLRSRGSQQVKRKRDEVDYKQWRCKRLQQTGECPYGEDCRYSHEDCDVQGDCREQQTDAPMEDQQSAIERNV